MNFSCLKYEINSNICTLVINRPEQLNALSENLIKELIDFYSWVDCQEEVMVIVMKGSGDKAFVAGADIKEMSDLDLLESKSYSALGQRLTLAIENLTKPVIAAINGYTLGGGCEIAMACHIRYASRKSKFGQPEVGLGLIAGFGGTQRLPRLVGKGIALELLLSGKMIDSEEALRINLVNGVVEEEELMDKCYSIANKIKCNAPVALEYTIKAVNKGESKCIQDALEVESNLFSQLFSTEDCKEGLNAFITKSKPKFTGK